MNGSFSVVPWRVAQRVSGQERVVQVEKVEVEGKYQEVHVPQVMHQEHWAWARTWVQVSVAPCSAVQQGYF